MNQLVNFRVEIESKHGYDTVTVKCIQTNEKIMDQIPQDLDNKTKQKRIGALIYQLKENHARSC